MPGIVALTDPPGATHVDTALRGARFYDDYRSQAIVSDDRAHVATTGYDEYPIETIEVDEFTVVLEGRLYDIDDTEGALTDVVEWVRSGDEAALAEWVGARDGDFLIVVTDRTDGSTWAINDAFGRLPTYRATIDGSNVLSRELLFLRKLANDLDGGLEPDHLGIGQRLWFGYLFGTRSLYEGVETLPPGSLYDVREDEVTPLHEFRFDRHGNAHRSAEKNAELLRERFLAACENRAETASDSIVSLSGGLDSRAVIAGYAEGDVPFYAATSGRADGSIDDEVNTAREVAEAVGAEWHSYVVERSRARRNHLLEMTQGMNSLGMEFGLHFAEQLSNDFPGATLVTGDGGDKAFPDLTPAKTLRGVNDLVDAVVTSQREFPIEDVVDLVDVSADELRNSLRDRLRTYPEETLDGRYVHFHVRERGINWLNHGENRTRYRMWTTTPFYSLPFFTAAMACPPEQKANYELYQTFLRSLSSNLLDVDYVDFGAPVGSLEYRIKRRVYDRLAQHPALKERVVNLVSGSGGSANEDVVRSLNDVLRDSSAIDQHFSRSALQRITWNREEYTSKQLFLLLTLTSAISYDPSRSRGTDESESGEEASRRIGRRRELS